MNHLFVPYQEALGLENIGFDEPCFAIYPKYGNDVIENYCIFGTYFKQNLANSSILKPLYSQVFDWFREKYSLQHEIFYQDDLMKNGFKITDISTNTELTEFVFKPNYFEDRGYEYKECELACLQSLIKMFKK